MGEPDLRLFLGLLSTQRSWKSLLDVVSQRVGPDDQEEAIRAWLHELETGGFLKKSSQPWTLAQWHQKDDEQAIDSIVRRARKGRAKT